MSARTYVAPLSAGYLTAFTCAAVTGAALLPHDERMYVSTAAISSGFSALFQAGITPLYDCALTTIAPCMPLSSVPMSLFGSPVTYGLPASGGNVPGSPLPAAP